MSCRRLRRGGSGDRTISYVKGAAPEKEHHIFVWDGGGRKVFLAGSFNNWTKIPLTVPYGTKGCSVDLALPPGTHHYIFEVDGVTMNDPANSMPLTSEGYNQVVIKSMAQMEEEVQATTNENDEPTQDLKDSVALFLKYPFQASRLIQAHLKTLGYGRYVKRYQWKSPNTAILIVKPASIGEEIISNVHGTKITGRYELNVDYYQPRYEKKRPRIEDKRPRIEERAITASGHCKLFIGSGLPRHTNEQHLKEHFEEFQQWITNVEVVRDRFTKQCKGYGYVTFSTMEKAHEAKDVLHHSKLLGTRVNVNFRTSRHQLPIGDRLVQEEHQLPSERDAVITLVVKTDPHLPGYASSTDLKNHFRGFESDIASAYVVKDVTHLYSLGAGVVQFLSVKAAEYAIEKLMNTKILSEYKIVDIYIDKERGTSNESEFDHESDPPSPQAWPKLNTSEKKKNSSFAESKQPTALNTVQGAQEPEASQAQACVIIRNLSLNLTESEISSIIAVPMISCKRFLPSSDLFIKCHTAADASSIVKKLHNKKVLKKVISVQLTAEEETPPQPESYLPQVAATNLVEPTASSINPVTTLLPPGNEDGIVYHLNSHEWNMLMLANPKNKVLLYNEIKEPFKNNPDIIFHPDHDNQCLRLSGKPGAVEDARSFLVRKLKQEIPVDNRYMMEALCNLVPDLPNQVGQHCQVLIKGFKPNSNSIKFEGSSSSIEKANLRVSSVMNDLKHENIKLGRECTPEEVARHNKSISSFQVFASRNPESTSSLTLWSFVAADIEKCKPLLSITIFELNCGQEEVVYLREFATAFTKSLPVKVDFEDEKVLLKGNREAVERSKLKIHKEILQDLYCRKFSFYCKPQIREFIEEVVLIPHSTEDSSFKYLAERSHQLMIEAAMVNVDVFIYSKDPESFSKISSALDCVSPSSKNFSISEPGTQRIVRENKASLENKYNVMISQIGRMTTIVIDGLIPADVQACHDELQELVENKLETKKDIPISPQLCSLLNLYQNDIREVQKLCNVEIPPRRKDSDNCNVTLAGTICLVKQAEEKLQDLLNMEVHSETFTLNCLFPLLKMWQKRWLQIKQQEERNTKTCVTFQVDFKNRKSHEMAVVFEIVGSNAMCVQESKEAIISEGTKTEEKVVSLSAAGIECFQKSMKTDKSPIKDLNADVKEVDQKSSEIILISPKELSESLDTAEELIRKFVGEQANANEFINSQEPVVNHILLHPLKGIEYVTKANALTQKHNVSVGIQKNPAGLRLTGTKPSIDQAKPLVKGILESIEELVGEKQLVVEYFYAPYLASSEFMRVQTKLVSDLCVACSYPKQGKTSTLLYSEKLSTSMPGLFVTVEVCRGDLVHEQVDAIVNAANDKLQHVGGLAKAILDAGGDSIQKESDEYISIHKKVATGSAVCLGSGELPCKKIVHAVGPRWCEGRKNEGSNLYKSVYESLNVAASEQLTSIAFPAIGTGVFNVPAIVSARESVKAVRDFFQNNQTTITLVRFVLFEATVSEFLSEVKRQLGSIYPRQHSSGMSPSLTTYYPFSPPPPYSSLAPEMPVWQWMNDQGSFTPSLPRVSAELEAAYKSNPTLPASVHINGNSYTIDFQRMEQVNNATGAMRKIRNSTSLVSASPVVSSDVQWEYRDRHVYYPYTSQQSAQIEKMYQDVVVGTISINNIVYNIDPTQMKQTNSLTKFSRKIRRQTGLPDSTVLEEDANDSEEFQMAAPRDILITLRGPHRDLQKAKAMLKEALKGSLLSYCFDKLPKEKSPKLEKKLAQIAQRHTLKWSFGTNDVKGETAQRVMNLEGVKQKCNSALKEIQEEVLNYHMSSADVSSVGITHPQEWEAQSQTTEVFKVKRGSQEWSNVYGIFTRTMQGSQVVTIERIQNKWLWEKYDYSKKRLHRKNDGRVNEKDLFHGTRGNDPKCIYEGEVGFDMRYSNDGLWGKANYFAADASYSDRYCYQSPAVGRQIFLVKLLTGESYNSPQNNKLKKPPEILTGVQGSQVQLYKPSYDTVTGVTQGVQVFMTYDNEKAYPAYLITYTNNSRFF